MGIKNTLRRRKVKAIFWSSKTLPETGSRFIQWIGRGPSIRSRVRLIAVISFLVALPPLLIGVIRTAEVANHAELYTDYDSFSKKMRSILLKAYDVRFEIAHLLELQHREEKEPVIDFETLSNEITTLVKNHPASFDALISNHLLLLSTRVQSLLNLASAEQDLLKNSHLAMAQSVLSTLIADLQRADRALSHYGSEQIFIVQQNLSKIGRDQLILFLILLLSLPFFVLLAPTWVVAPLYRLKGLAQRIEEGRLRDISVVGRDEISSLTKSLKRVLLWRDSLEQKKSAKIFELRNVIRTLAAHSYEYIIVINHERRINYTNKSLATLIGTEQHSIEGELLERFFIAPQLFEAIDRALNGDIESKPIAVNIELSSAKVLRLSADIGTVHDRNGDISRVVIVMRPEQH